MSGKLLYDVVQILEWPPEEEKIQEVKNHNTIMKASYELIATSSKKALNYFPGAGIPYKKVNYRHILETLSNLVQQQKWRFAICPDRKFVAILQKLVVEVRCLDEDLTIIGNYSFPATVKSGKQVLVWDGNSTAFAVSLNGEKVYLFANTCTLLSTIKLTPDSATDEMPLVSVCSMIFMKPRSQKQIYDWELLVLMQNGALASYFVSHSGGCELGHTFNFGSSYTQGISCAFKDESNRLLVLGGNTNCTFDCDAELSGNQFGITKWRVLSDFPYYKRDLGESINSAGRYNKGMLTRAYSYSKDVFQKLYTLPMDGVYAMSLSPDQSKLAAAHFNGDLSLCEFPSLRLKSKWSLQDQPHHSDVNPDRKSRFGRKRRHDEIGPVRFYPFDVSWWNDEAIVVTRCSGSLTILSVVQEELVNLFGDQCEWVTPCCQISSSVNERFYMLECKVDARPSKKKKTASMTDDDDDDDDDDSSLLQKGLYMAKYYSGMAPPKIKERRLSNTYSLAMLTKTTPQELYQRKIDDKEFGEALSIAQAYGLDCDKVFQRQWRNSPVSKATIQDYLSKIGNRHWVFRECLDRVPERMDDMKELLDFALRITDIDKLVQITNINFDPSSDDDVVDDYDGFDYEVQKQREIEKRQKFEKKCLEHVDLNKLTLDQNEILSCRQKIVKYKDRLSTYILLQGGYDAANERYTANSFAIFRKRDLFQLALDYVRSSKWESLDILLQYHHELHAHWLPLLSNFSETVSPSLYECLLPEVVNGKVSPILSHQHRQQSDWCETTNAVPVELDVEEFYENNSILSKFSTNEMTPSLAGSWYQHRAREMEKLTQQTEEALKLIEIGIQKGISGLSQLLFDLTTLDNLVFECGCELVLSLDDLVQKSPLERIQLMMAQSIPTTYVRDLQQLVLPFVETCKEEKLFKTYLMEAAQQNLVLPFLVFKYMASHKQDDFGFKSKKEAITTAIQCIYAMELAGQLDIAYRIMACLPKYEGLGKSEVKEKISALERNLDACGLFAKHKLPMTPNQLVEVAQDRKLVLLLFKRLTRTLAREEVITAKQVSNVLEDMLSISTSMFSSMIDQTTSIHVLIESLLTSAVVENIKLAGNLMARSEEATPSGQKFQLPYKESVELVLSSAREYFDAASIPLHNNKLLQISRLCLQLITDRPPAIQEQLDLIEAVALLSAFGLEMLPLEVRLCKDRLEIVQKILDLSSANYLKIEAIMRLSSLLNVSGSDVEERKGRTTCIIAAKALKEKNFEVAARLVHDLVSMNYAQGWQLCAQLGACKDLADLRLRHNCISFASCYCDENNLVTMTEELCKVTALLLEQTLEEQITQLEELPMDSEKSVETAIKLSELPVSRTLKASADILAGTMSVTTGVLRSGLSLLRRESNTSLPSMSHPLDVTVQNHGDNDFETQSCPGFYKTIVETADNDVYNIERYVSPAGMSIAQQQTMLRISSLAGMDDRLLENLKTLASESLNQDLPLALSYLLAIADAKHVEECFQAVPLTSLSLQMRVYYHSLKVHHSVVKMFGTLRKSTFRLRLSGYLETASSLLPLTSESLPMYRAAPVSFVDEAIRSCDFRGSATSSSPLQEAVSSLVDFIQGEKLSQLGQDVDVGRCMMDASYLEETAHGLALTSNEDQFLVAVLLAEQGNCDVWQVLASHVEYLFTETKVSQEELFEKLGRLRVLPALVARGKSLFERLDSQVFPLIDGRDHSTLLCYFNLLKECNWNELESLGSVNDVCQQPPQTHIRQLQKIQNCVPELDYKMLIRKNSSPEILQLLRKHLDSGNIAMLTKIIPKIPYENYSITPSSIVLCWVQKRFWQTESSYGDDARWMRQSYHMHLKVRDYETNVVFITNLFNVHQLILSDFIISWFHPTRLEQLNKWLVQLEGHDLKTFFEDLLFSEDSVKNFSHTLRWDFLKFGLKFIKVHNDNKKSSSTDAASINTLKTFLEQLNKHFIALSTKFMKEVRQGAHADKHKVDFLISYDLSRSQSLESTCFERGIKLWGTNSVYTQPDKVLPIAIESMYNSVEFTKRFLAILPDIKWTVEHVLTKCTNQLTQRLSEASDESATESALSSLERLLFSIEGCKGREKTKLFNQVVSIVQDFCNDQSVDIKLKIDVLQLLRQFFNHLNQHGPPKSASLSTSQMEFLLFHRTSELIRSGWSDSMADIVLKDIKNISDELAHSHIVNSLLAGESNSLEQINTLVKIVEILLQDSGTQSSLHDEIWQNVLLAFARHGTDDGSQVVAVCKQRKLTEKVAVSVFEELYSKTSVLSAVKLALISKISSVDDKIKHLLQDVIKVDQSNCDDELLQLLIDSGKVLLILSTLYYHRAVEYLTSEKCENADEKVDRLVRQLQDNGHISEASTLLSKYRGSHTVFATFGTSISFISDWLSKF